MRKNMKVKNIFKYIYIESDHFICRKTEISALKCAYKSTGLKH